MSSKINYASATVAAELAKAKRAQNPQHKEKTSTKPTPKYTGWVKAEGPTQGWIPVMEKKEPKKKFHGWGTPVIPNKEWMKKTPSEEASERSQKSYADAAKSADPKVRFAPQNTKPHHTIPKVKYIHLGGGRPPRLVRDYTPQPKHTDRPIRSDHTQRGWPEWAGNTCPSCNGWGTIEVKVKTRRQLWKEAKEDKWIAKDVKDYLEYVRKNRN